MKFQQPLQVTNSTPYPNLPPPVTTGGLITFVDSAGETWVAKPGVAGGAWVRARDVLQLRGYRNATGNNTGNGTFQIVWDATADDVYGMQSGGGFTCVVPGLYLIVGTMSVAGAVVGDWYGTVSQINGVGYLYSQNFEVSVATITARVTFNYGLVRLNVNDIFTVLSQSNVVRALVAGVANTWWNVKYIGTG